MIDIHCHLLFGVDDGAKTFEESVAMLEDAARQGIKAMILTPHYRRGMFAYPKEKIEEHFTKLRNPAKKAGIRIYLGCEYHVNGDIIEYLENGRCLKLAQTRYVLAEYSHDTPYDKIRQTTTDLLYHGYTPVIAHVERYQCLVQDTDRLDELQQSGNLIQVNADAVLGKDGFKTKHVCKRLLSQGLVDIIASDSHGIRERASHMEACYKYVEKKYGSDTAALLFVQNPGKIVDNNG